MSRATLINEAKEATASNTLGGWKNLARALIFLMLAFAMAMSAHAQLKDWRTLFAQAGSLYGQGQADQAALVLESRIKGVRLTPLILGIVVCPRLPSLDAGD